MRRNGFTLIELLVVIVTVAALLAIVLPVVHTSRQHARAIVCGSNTRQLSLAMMAYEQGNGTFPYGFYDVTYDMNCPPGGCPGTPMYDKRGGWWFHFLAGTLEENFDKGTIIWCPSRNIRTPLLEENVLCGNYGVNRSICKDSPGETGTIGSEFVGTPLGLHQIDHPHETLLLIDSGYSLVSWRAASNAPPPLFDNPMREGSFYVPGLEINGLRAISPGCEQDAIDGRHPNKTINVTFADGHFARIKADDLFVEETSSSYNNRYPLWRPNK